MAKEITKEETTPVFTLQEVDDVRVIIKVKDKHYSIIANDTVTKEEAKEIRIGLLAMLLEFHWVVAKPLEEIKPLDNTKNNY